MHASGSIYDLFNIAVGLHQAGKLSAAAREYQHVLSLDPHHIDSLHNLGLIAYQIGKPDVAIAFVGQAVAKNDRIPNFHNTLGISEHARGDFDRAILHFRKALALRPDYPEVHNNLGSILKDQDKLDDAITHFGRALELRPDYADAHINMATVHKRKGELDEAVRHCRRALEIIPKHPHALYNLGNILRAQGQLEAAITQYELVLAFYPDHPEAHNNLGSALAELGKLEVAAIHFRQALAIRPKYADAHNNLGAILKKQKKVDEAVLHYQKALELNPNFADAHNNLGVALKELGRLSEAIEHYQRALSLAPNHAEAHNNFANALFKQGELSKAIEHYERSLSLKPNVVEVQYNFGVALHKHGALSRAVEHYHKALRLDENNAEARNNLGAAMKDQGQIDDALAQFENILVRDPGNSVVHSNLLFCSMYHWGLSSERLFGAHRDWNRAHGEVRRPNRYDNEPSESRQLRVGYVSGDFCVHPVASFLAPLLRRHDRGQVMVFCYAQVENADEVTEEFKKMADQWRMTVGCSDEQLAAQIAADEIDILIDLAGHTAGNRLPVFARKPAPVQVTWLGYPNSTGLSTIDFRVVDSITDPPGDADHVASERLFRLEPSFLCFEPPPNTPMPTPPPSLETGWVTFGSFNNPTKIAEATVEVWAEVLRRVPRSRLLLKGLPFDDEPTRAAYAGRFADLGIPSKRLMLVGRTSARGTHLARYSELDIALDPFPYNGTTTTCEALWMGVPVVTLRGTRHSGRVGASLMTNVGHCELIAENVDKYIDIAVCLAREPSRLDQLRLSLRSEMQASPLCDGAGFARRMEAAYRTMWEEWCGRVRSPSS